MTNMIDILFSDPPGGFRDQWINWALPYRQCIDCILVMHEVNLRGVDLNLLVMLEALIRERNVTRAAEAVAMSQPAMSRALARLRRLLDDPILVRGPEGLQPTIRARSLQPRLAALLNEAKGLIEPKGFDPLTYRGEWRIASTDHQTILQLPLFMARLAREAPHVDLRVSAASQDVFEKLGRGEIDLAFGVAETRVPQNLKRQGLYRDRFVTMLRRGHPALADWSLERFVALDHVLVTILDLDAGRGVMDDALEALGLSRRIALRLPHFFAAINIVATSDLVVTLPFTIAERFREEYRLAAIEPPLAYPHFEVISLWSEAVDHDPAGRFLRAIARDEARRIPGAMPL
jgi:DNA-binding transcriptional LysR family regulator